MQAPWIKYPLLSEGPYYGNNSHTLLDLLEVSAADLYHLAIVNGATVSMGMQVERQTRKCWINESNKQQRDFSQSDNYKHLIM